MVVSVTISRWFVRNRGRAIATASLGQRLIQGVDPDCHRGAFYLGRLARHLGDFRHDHSYPRVDSGGAIDAPQPGGHGIKPDGIDEPEVASGQDAKSAHPAGHDGVRWSRREIVRTETFWIICFMYGMANVGIAGLNLHVFAYVTDIGFPTIVAATTLTIIASTQLGSTLIWGLISERIDIRHSSMVMFFVQAIGLTLVISFSQLPAVYSGFFLYGVGLGGSFVLQELIWATYFGRLSLGTVRGLGILVTYAFGAAGAPFFGFVHDVTGSYRSSFIAFAIALVLAAFLSLTVRAPQKGLAAGV